MADPTPDGAPPVVSLSGEIDLAQAPAVQERLDELLDGGATTIVVDLREATFLDSVALGVLVSALKRCRDAGGTVHLVVTEPRIVKVLKITGLLDEFCVHDNLTSVNEDHGKERTMSPDDSDAVTASEVELTFPAAEELVTLARFTAATVAARAGFDVDEVEDLRLAVDELCASVGTFGDGSSIRLNLSRRGDMVRIRCVSEHPNGSGAAGGTMTEDWQPSEISEQLLGVLVDRYAFERHLDRPSGWLEKKRGRATA